MLQRTLIKNAQQISYRSYLKFNATSHPDGFISPKDWINVWNMHQWELMTQPVRQNQTTPSMLPCQSSAQKTE